MDKYSKLLAVLFVLTSVLIVGGNMAYAKYLASGHRLPSTVQAI
jgi:hypothetical protein